MKIIDKKRIGEFIYKHFLSHLKCILYARKIKLEDISEREISYKIICPDYFDPDEIKDRYVNALTGALSTLIKNSQREFEKVKHPRILNNLKKLYPDDKKNQIKFLYNASLIVEQIDKSTIREDVNWLEPKSVNNISPFLLHLLKNYDVSSLTENRDFSIDQTPKNDSTNLSLFCSKDIEIDTDRIASTIEEKFNIKVNIEKPIELRDIPQEFVFYKFTKIPDNEELGNKYYLIKLDSVDYEFILKKIPGKPGDAILTTIFPVYEDRYPLFNDDKPVVYDESNVYVLENNITRTDKRVKDIFTESCSRKGYISLIEPIKSDKSSLVLGQLNYIGSKTASYANFTKDELKIKKSLKYGTNHLEFSNASPVIDGNPFIALEYDFVSYHWWLVEKSFYFNKGLLIYTVSDKQRVLPSETKPISKGGLNWTIYYYDLSVDNGFYITVGYYKKKNIFETRERYEYNVYELTEDDLIDKKTFFIYLGTGQEKITSITTTSTENAYEEFARTILQRNVKPVLSAAEGPLFYGEINGIKAFLKIYNKPANWSTFDQKEFYNDIIKDLLFFNPVPLNNSLDFKDKIYLDIKNINGVEKVVTLMPEFKIFTVKAVQKGKNIRPAIRKIQKIIDFIRDCNEKDFYCFDILLHEEEKMITSNWAEYQNRFFNIDLGAYYKKGKKDEFDRYREAFKTHRIPKEIDPDVWQLYLLGVLIFQIWNSTTSIPAFESQVDISGKAALELFVNNLIQGKYTELDQNLINELKNKIR